MCSSVVEGTGGYVVFSWVETDPFELSSLYKLIVQPLHPSVVMSQNSRVRINELVFGR